MLEYEHCTLVGIYNKKSPPKNCSEGRGVAGGVGGGGGVSKVKL